VVLGTSGIELGPNWGKAQIGHVGEVAGAGADDRVGEK